MKYYLIVCFSLLTFSLSAQDIPSYNLEELETRIYSTEDVTYIVNFWATWCVPCIKELPYFEGLEKKYKDDPKVKVILVSLDFANAKENRLIPFVKNKQIKSEVIHFIEKDANYWIPRINKNWSGSIPATLVLNGDRKVKEFYEKSFESLEELEELLP